MNEKWHINHHSTPEDYGDRVSLGIGPHENDDCDSFAYSLDFLEKDGVPEDVERKFQLMAAAPELLAACQLWDQGFVDGEEFDIPQLLAWINKNRKAAREAIAKALGR